MTISQLLPAILSSFSESPSQWYQKPKNPLLMFDDDEVNLIHKHQHLSVMDSNQCQKRVSIARILNRIMNFGTGSGQPVPATNH